MDLSLGVVLAMGATVVVGTIYEKIFNKHSIIVDMVVSAGVIVMIFQVVHNFNMLF